jgi:hypothetical protein
VQSNPAVFFVFDPILKKTALKRLVSSMANLESESIFLFSILKLTPEGPETLLESFEGVRPFP